MSDLIAMDVTGAEDIVSFFEQLGTVDRTPRFKKAMHDGAKLVTEKAKENLDKMIYATPSPAAERKRAEGLHGKTVPLENYKLTDSLAITTVATLAFWAPFVHFGTGVAGSAKGNRQEPWVFRDADGEFHLTVGQEPKPYLTKALKQAKKDYMNMLFLAITMAPNKQ